MIKLLATILIAVLSSASGLSAQPSQEEMQATGEAWLLLIDHRQYSESWQKASSGFRTQVSEQKWTEAMKGSREPLGAAASRKLLRLTFAQALPGVADGEYAVLQFQTSYVNKADSVETVTFSFEDGKWKCAGFFIR